MVGRQGAKAGLIGNTAKRIPMRLGTDVLALKPTDIDAPPFDPARLLFS